jgi:8-amino-7-oxononanoate synthase
MEQALAADLQSRREQHLYRQRRCLSSPQGARITLDGKPLLGFSSNDYLGLANHPDVIRAFKTAADDYGVGSGASHLITGHSYHHHALEEELAAFCNRPRALLFSTGYMANLGVISALAGRGDGVFEDRLNHASLLDGGLLSGARFQRYGHNDSQSLQIFLGKQRLRRKLVVTDGVFSMDGDIADLPGLSRVCQQQGAWLMVDDAHGFGVLGQNGGGVAELFGLDDKQLPILMGTLGKGFGTFGAFVAGSENLVESLIQFSRTYIYTTALPPAVAAATRTSLALLQKENWRRDRLASLIRRFRQGAEQLGLQLLPSTTPIQPVVIGDDGEVQRVGAALFEQGFHVGAIRYPTVPKGSARLRITLSAAHSEQDVDQLLAALERCLVSSAGDPP